MILWCIYKMTVNSRLVQYSINQTTPTSTWALPPIIIIPIRARLSAICCIKVGQNHLCPKNSKSKSLTRLIPANPKSKDTPPITSRAKTRPTAMLQYIYDLSEKLQRIFNKESVNMIHKPPKTTCDMLVHPKDKTPYSKKCGLLFLINCNNCDQKHASKNTTRKKWRNITEKENKPEE